MHVVSSPVKRMKPLFLSLALLAAFAAVASAATFRGPTTQDRSVVLRTNDRGLVTRMNIGFRAPCTDDKRLKAGTFFRAPFDLRTHDRIRDEGSYRFRLEDERIRAHVKMRGFRLKPRKWAGRYKGTFVVRRDGEVVARCETPLVRWRAFR
jgi:hypothetical protein